MSAPPKPWEIAGANQRVYPLSGGLSGSDPLQSAAPTVGLQFPGQIRQVRNNVPPIPPRPHRQPLIRQAYTPGGAGYFPSYPSYGGGYGSNYGSYSGYGGYNSSYGNYGGYGMNRYGFPPANNPESRFIQMAEEGSRPAFQSIESLVHAFGSVSFMLESTFNAMYSSFRAVLGVAENFGRLRSLFGQFFSVFAIFRTLQWLYKKCLYLLGLRREDPGPGREALWSQAASEAVQGGTGTTKPRSSWPILVFLGILFSGPYLMWKLLNSLNISTTDPYNSKDWVKCKEPTFVAVVLHDFVASTEQELSIYTGHRLVIAPKECQPYGFKNWILATDQKKVGLVPANYIKITGRVIAKRSVQARTSPSSVPITYDGPSTSSQAPQSAQHIPSAHGDGGEWDQLPHSSWTPQESSDSNVITNILDSTDKDSVHNESDNGSLTSIPQ